MDQLSIRTGNIVRYMGGLRDFYDRPAEVISIDLGKDEVTYLLRVKNWAKEVTEIRAYKDEIWPLYLEVSHLEKLGYVKEEHRNVFNKDGLNLIRPIFIKRLPEGGLFYDDKGFVVVEKTLPVPFEEGQLEGSTRPATYLHYLQNYWGDRLHKTIDVDVLL
ncbi:MAG: hypothetical protein ACTHMM_08890 [Agriterribacter sp.]